MNSSSLRRQLPKVIHSILERLLHSDELPKGQHFLHLRESKFDSTPEEQGSAETSMKVICISNWKNGQVYSMAIYVHPGGARYSTIVLRNHFPGPKRTDKRKRAKSEGARDVDQVADGSNIEPGCTLTSNRYPVGGRYPVRVMWILVQSNTKQGPFRNEENLPIRAAFEFSLMGLTAGVSRI